ncbi:YadA family autotransporter adhesin [Paraburkholderia solisilvae]
MPFQLAALNNPGTQSKQRSPGAKLTTGMAMIALGVAALYAPGQSFASAITIADTDKATGTNCTTTNAGSGTWSVVGGCFANAGVKDAPHNLAETVVGAYGYVPANVSFASGFGFSNQTYAYFGSALGAASYVAGAANNSVALGTGSVASEANTVSLGRVGDSPLKGTFSDGGDGNSSDTALLNQNLTGTLTRRLTNMSAGINNTDAVNVGQLKAAGMNIDTSGNVTNAFVAYDDTTRGKVTLAGGTAGTTITNVKAGTLSAASMDAVNGAQLNATNANVTNVTNTVNNITNGNAGIKYFHVNSTLADSTASGTNAMAIGAAASTNGQSAVAVGTTASASADWTVAMGNAAAAKGAGDVALGASSLANGGAGSNYSTAVGANAQATAANTGAFGAGAKATVANSVALGSNSTGDRANSVAVGNASLQRQITYVAKGTADTDAVNLAQLKAAGATIDTSGNVTNAFVAYDDATKGVVTLAGGLAGTTITNVKAGAVSAGSKDAINGSQLYGSASSMAAALGGGSIVAPDGSITMPRYTVGGDTVIGVDGAVDALDQRITDASAAAADISTKLKFIKFGDTSGQDANASGDNAVAIGPFAQATGDNALAMGANARATAVNSIAIGAGSSTNQANTFAVGSNTAKRRIVNVADGVNYSDAVTFGQMNAAIAAALPGQTVKGALLQAAPLAAGIGVATPDDAANAIAYDSTARDRVTLGGAAATARVALSNLQDADLSATSTDAVTGAQLYATNQQVEKLGEAVQNYSANGSSVIASGMASGPATATGSNSFAAGSGASAAGNASTALGDRAKASGTASVALGSQASATANNSVALGANAVASRDNTVSVGAPEAERQIVNVAAGVQGTDAVNVNQLNATVANTNQQISGLQGQINSVAKGANAGTAAAMAVAGLPQPTQPGKTMVALAGARYGGQSGAAFGASYVTQNNRFVVKLSGNTSTNGNVGVVAGAGFQW